MNVPGNATSLILLVRLVDASNSAITGVAFNDAQLTFQSLKYGESSWQDITLVAGTLGTYVASGWVELGDGDYQFCPNDNLVVEGRTTHFRLVYAPNDPQYGSITADSTSAGSPDELFVSKSGNDANNGTFASPKLTITAALTAAVSGQTVRVLDGIYDERNLLRDGVTLDFAPGSGVSYTGADGAVFDDGAGALSARVTGHGQLAHAGSGAIQDLIRATNGSQIEVFCESAESGLVVLRNQSASFIRFTANSAIAGDGLIDSLDANAVTFVKLGTAVSSSYICEMDGGYMSVEADSLTSTGQMVVECVEGHVAIQGADMTSAAGEPTVNNSGTVSLVECNLLSDDGTYKVTSFGIFNATNCNVLDSEVLLLGGGSKTIIPNLEPLATEANATTNRETVVTAVEAVEGGGGGLTGPNTITLTVENESSEAIEGAAVRMYRSGESQTKLSDVNGEASFTVADATWSIAVTASGFDGDASTIVVPTELTKTVTLAVDSQFSSEAGWIG